LAAILSGVKLLDYLADRRGDVAPRTAARRIDPAVAAALAAGEAQTRDVGGSARTQDAAAAVRRRIG
jgi:3-isopropylmalate dehydrogenase